jgi:alpha-tubulin suppressor-like RCC1 family protein
MLLTVFLFTGTGTVFAFTAHVQTPGGAPVPGVSVTFANFDTTVYSNANGDVSLTHVVSVLAGVKSPLPASLRMSNRHISVYLPSSGAVELRLYTLSGRALFSRSQDLESGSHSVSIPVMAPGIYILKARIGALSFVRKVNILAGYRWHEALQENTKYGKLEKTAASADTAFFSKSGYTPVNRPFASYGDSLGIVIMDLIGNNPNIRAVSTGSGYTMTLLKDGTLWATGTNNGGQLCDGTITNISTPKQVMSGISEVSAGFSYTMILKMDSTLWAVGENSFGNLGDGTKTTAPVPKQIMTGVVSVSTGQFYTMIIKQGGALWATGLNSSGEFGDGSNTNKSTPIQVMSGVSSVSLGSSHTLILKQDSTLWTTGWNHYGELGTGDTIDRNVPVQIISGVTAVSAGSGHSMFLKRDGSLWAMGENLHGQLGLGDFISRKTPVQVMTGVAAVSSGGLNTMILKLDGTLWATGYNTYFQLGTGDSLDRNTPVQIATNVAAVSAGYVHTMFLKQDGTLWAMGNNVQGAFGDGTTSGSAFPIQVWPVKYYGLTVSSGTGSGSYVGGFKIFTLAYDSSALFRGFDHWGGPDSFLISNSSIFTMPNRSAAIKAVYFDFSTLTVIGGSGSGKYANGRMVSITANDSTAANRGFDHWGGQDSSLVYNNKSKTTTFTMPNGPAIIKSVYDDLHALTVISGSGSGNYLHDSIVRVTANDSTAAKRGFDHWGGPDSSLILNVASKTTTFKMPNRSAVIQVVYGDLHDFSVDGGNGSGSFIQGINIWISANDSTAAKRAFDHWGGRDSSLVTNDILQSTSFTMPAKDAMVRAIYNTGCVVTFDKNGGTVDASPTQSGLISSGRRILSMPLPPRRNGYWFLSWNRHADGSGTEFSDTSIVATDITVFAQWINVVTTMSAGNGFSMFIGQGGSLFATGYNSFGQLGDGTTANKFTPVHIMNGVVSVASASFGNYTMILKQDKTLWATGNNLCGQLGTGDTSDVKTPVQVMSGVSVVRAGNSHTMCLKQDGTLWAMGRNLEGQLGVGDTINRKTPVQVMTGVSAVSTGDLFTMILKQDSTLWTTGYNRFGQLGAGDSLNRKTPIQIMSGVLAISAGVSHSMILKKDNSLWAVGLNSLGELGTGDIINRKIPIQVMSGVLAVSAGGFHTMIIKQDNTLWATGVNREGELGDGTTVNKSTPVQVMNGVLRVSAGNYHTIILKQDGTLWATGANSHGELGDGTTVNKSTPVQIIP